MTPPTKSNKIVQLIGFFGMLKSKFSEVLDMMNIQFSLVFAFDFTAHLACVIISLACKFLLPYPSWAVIILTTSTPQRMLRVRGARPCPDMDTTLYTVTSLTAKLCIVNIARLYIKSLSAYYTTLCNAEFYSCVSVVAIIREGSIWKHVPIIIKTHAMLAKMRKTDFLKFFPAYKACNSVIGSKETKKGSLSRHVAWYTCHCLTSLIGLGHAVGCFQHRDGIILSSYYSTNSLLERVCSDQRKHLT